MTRKIIVNGRFLSRPITGVERYGREILRLLPKDYQLETTHFNGVAGHVWEQFILPPKLMAGRSQNFTLWSPANTGPLFVRQQAVTIHDLSPLEHPEWFQRSFALWYRLFLPILARRVRHVFTPSEYMKQKVQQVFGVRDVTVAPNGVDTDIFHPDKKSHPLDFPKKYILFVGSVQPRKNLAGLLQAWQQVKADFSDLWLVVAGEPGRVFRPVKFLGDEQVRFLNYVPDALLPALYAKAHAFVLPSFDEGFGLPALEAMACGTPTLVSNGGALPEVVGDAALVFDLSEPSEFSGALRMILSDKNLRATLTERGFQRVKKFSWQTTAELIWKTLNAI